MQVWVFAVSTSSFQVRSGDIPLLPLQSGCKARRQTVRTHTCVVELVASLDIHTNTSLPLQCAALPSFPAFQTYWDHAMSARIQWSVWIAFWSNIQFYPGLLHTHATHLQYNPKKWKQDVAQLPILGLTHLSVSGVETNTILHTHRVLTVCTCPTSARSPYVQWRLNCMPPRAYILALSHLHFLTREDLGLL